MRAPFKTKRIDAGKYRTPCVVERPVETVADMHSVEITWTKYASRRVSMDSAWGNELTVGMTTVPQKRGIVRTRYDSESAAITPRMRLRIGDRVLNLESVDDDNGEHREVLMKFVEEVAT